jgi:hypothetical protein
MCSTAMDNQESRVTQREASPFPYISELWFTSSIGSWPYHSLYLYRARLLLSLLIRASNLGEGLP